MEMAKRIGTQQPQLSRWEHGGSHPPAMKMKAAAEALGESAAVFCMVADEAMVRATHMVRLNSEGSAPTLEELLARLGIHGLRTLVCAAVYLTWGERR